MWFWLHILNGLLPVSIKRPLMRLIFPLAKHVNLFPYRKFFLIRKA
jgi:hypothetical protein